MMYSYRVTVIPCYGSRRSRVPVCPNVFVRVLTYFDLVLSPNVLCLGSVENGVLVVVINVPIIESDIDGSFRAVTAWRAVTVSPEHEFRRVLRAPQLR